MTTLDPKELIAIVAGLVAVVTALFSIIGAMRAGVLRQLRVGSIELTASPQEREQAKAFVDSIKATSQEDVPFETQQLALYYAQILAQSKISFWFSLVFASLGFGVIIAAVFLYSGSNTGATVVQFTAGVVIDAVAALFFVQSKNAQKAMGEFFDKLRRDRQHLESRRLADSVENLAAKDALRVNLSLHYAEVVNADAIAKTISEVANFGGTDGPPPA